VERLQGTVMDVTSRKVVELRQSMEHTVTRLLAESDSPAEVMPEVIQTICETLGWVCGALWKLDKQSGSLQRSVTWSVPYPRIEEFFHTSKPFIQAPAPGSLIARALDAGAPVWNQDVARAADFGRAAAAHESGLCAAFAFPVQAGGKVFGVMEFFTEQAQRADQEMLQCAHFIGRHVGQFFQRKQAQDALRESEAHFRSLVEQASDSFYVHDLDGRIIDVNQHGCDCLGYRRQELLAMSMAEIDIDLSISELKYLRNQVSSKAPVALESRHKRKDGSIFPVEIRMGPIDINGQRHLLSLVRDVTERKELQDHIQHLAYHDSLTDLPNRAMFNRQLSHAILQAQRHEKGLAVLFIDLDRFKNINDTLGHDAGDRLLQEMARRIEACLRGGEVAARMDGGSDLVARLGGDEFVVLLEDVADAGHVIQVARKLLGALVKEYPLEGQLIHVTASIGISTFPEDGRNEFSLMKHADIAMYRAKDRGKNNFQFYSAQMDVHSAELLALESSLRRAPDRDEFVIYYQAKVDANTGRITGAEALVRWQHPELGLVSPIHFIALAEESGLIVPLSKWVLNDACRQSLAWQRQGLPPIHIAVNLSARQFSDENLFADTMATLHEIGMDPSLLELEITESMMMYNTDRTIEVLAAFRKQGIRIAIDDFGIGYSSLSHLKQFPIDIIKIDRSFIKDIPGDHADEAITEAIIVMGRSLRIKVVAEGVETAQQLHFVRSHGCDEIQGYFFSRPIPADAFANLLRTNSAKALARAG
jgi:diguanylate cyclase (GGDEF)-like protein/PAS domain S-box-containing protein